MPHAEKVSLGTRLQSSLSRLLGVRREAAKPPNPFTPGAGMLPPFLAGRRKQTRILNEALLQALTQKLPTPHDFAMVGQRGIGKTTLAVWLHRKAERLGIRVVKLSPRSIPCERDLMLQTLPKSVAAAAESRTAVESTSRLEAALGPLAAQRGETRRVETQGRVNAPSWWDAMESAARQQPCLIIADEAQHFRPDIAGPLFEGVQEMRGRKAPVALIIAGTPDTWDALGKAGATFQSRLGRGRLSLNLLDEAASMQAISEGIKASGLDIKAEEVPLRMAYADAQGYPYFLQVWGEALYNRLDWPREQAIRPEHVEAAWPEVNKIRTEYYSDRWREMLNAEEFGSSGLVPVCAAVARGMIAAGGDSAVLADGDLDDLIAEGLAVGGAGAINEARQLLTHMGFIVKSRRDGLSEAGIPSLMRHTLQAAMAAKRIPSDWADGLDLDVHPPKRPATSPEGRELR